MYFFGWANALWALSPPFGGETGQWPLLKVDDPFGFVVLGNFCLMGRELSDLGREMYSENCILRGEKKTGGNGQLRLEGPRAKPLQLQAKKSFRISSVTFYNLCDLGL